MSEQPADEALLPALTPIDEAGDITARDVFETDLSYELVKDNLLDLSHTAFLHPGVLGDNATPNNASVEVTQEGNTFTVTRWMRNVSPLGLIALLYQRTTARRWATGHTLNGVPPSCPVNDTGVTRQGKSIAEGTGIIGFNLLTP